MYDRFNPATYQVIDRITGEEVDVSIFIQKVVSGGWEKAYAKVIADYIECGDGQSVTFLAYVLRKKDHRNHIYGTQREFAKNCGVSLSIINRTVKLLQEKRMIRKVRNGCYMLTPEMIRNGSRGRGVILFKVWDELEK